MISNLILSLFLCIIQAITLVNIMLAKAVIQASTKEVLDLTQTFTMLMYMTTIKLMTWKNKISNFNNKMQHLMRSLVNLSPNNLA